MKAHLLLALLALLSTTQLGCSHRGQSSAFETRMATLERRVSNVEAVLMRSSGGAVTSPYVSAYGQ